MKPSTRDRIVRVAHDLFYIDGFHMVGLDRIFEAASVTKTTFYNHFESKDELILEVLNWHDQWWREHFCKLLREHGGYNARDQLLAVGKAFEQVFEEGNFNGCIFINVAVIFPLQHDPAHQTAARHKQAMEEIIAELAGYAGIADPKSFAQEYGLILEGGYVTRQVTNNPETASIVERLASVLVEKHLPQTVH